MPFLINTYADHYHTASDKPTTASSKFKKKKNLIKTRTRTHYGNQTLHYQISEILNEYNYIYELER